MSAFRYSLLTWLPDLSQAFLQAIKIRTNFGVHGAF
jgi:hypothetical protein